MSNEVNPELDDIEDKYSLVNTKKKKVKLIKCEDCYRTFKSVKQLEKHVCKDW